MRYAYRGPQHHNIRNQKPNAEVFAHCQHSGLGVLGPVVSLPTNFCLSSEIQPVLLGINTLKPEQEKAILQFPLGRDVFVALPTGYGKACATSFYRWYLTESRM